MMIIHMMMTIIHMMMTIIRMMMKTITAVVPKIQNDLNQRYGGNIL